MRISKRRDRDKTRMRQEIIKAALKIFIDEGFDKTSIRRIAAGIGYSPTTIYLYFKNKTDIFCCLHDYVFEQFYNRLLTVDHVENPFEKLTLMTCIFFDFAYSNTNFYHLMFIMHSPEGELDTTNEWNYGIRSLNVLRQTVSDCMDQGYMKKREVEVVSFSLWSLMHGIASLTIQERLKLYTADEIKSLTDRSTEMFLELLKKES